MSSFANDSLRCSCIDAFSPSGSWLTAANDRRLCERSRYDDVRASRRTTSSVIVPTMKAVSATLKSMYPIVHSDSATVTGKKSPYPTVANVVTAQYSDATYFFGVVSRFASLPCSRPIHVPGPNVGSCALARKNMPQAAQCATYITNMRLRAMVTTVSETLRLYSRYWKKTPTR